MSEPTSDWIAVDHSPDALRIWAMQGSAVLEQAVVPVQNDGFVAALRILLDDWQVDRATPIILCGDAGTDHVALRAVPCKPLEADPVEVTGHGLTLLSIHGLKQSSPPDMMQGDETRIAGYLALNPGWDGVICLPGTHTRWAQVSAGEVVSFQTFITGELLGLLANDDMVPLDSPDLGDAFSDAVSGSLSRPERLAAQLFAIRADQHLHGRQATVARSRLSGILIGSELAAARPYWLGQNIALIGNAAQAAPYAEALKLQGVPVTVADAARMTLAGLTAAHRLMKDKT